VGGRISCRNSHPIELDAQHFKGIGCGGLPIAAARRHLQPTSSSPKKSADGDAYVTATNSSSPAGDSVMTNIHSRQCRVSSFDGHARSGHDLFVDEQIGGGAMADTRPEEVQAEDPEERGEPLVSEAKRLLQQLIRRRGQFIHA
jgi:hypothetical protein